MSSKLLSNIGERNAIELIAKIVDAKKQFIGDDCAFIDLGKNYLLITTDISTQKTHFPKQMSFYEVGWHSVAINLSDIASKGGEPIGLVMALGLPKNFKVKNLKQLSEGMFECGKKFNAKILGGDTKENDNLTICGTAIGLVKKKNLMRRKNAKIGDLVCTTNYLGYGFLGYVLLNCYKRDFGTEKLHKENLIKIDEKFAIMKNEKQKLDKKSRKEFYNELVKNLNAKKILKRFFMPIPRLKEGIVLSRFANCCMDNSDGLASSLYQLSSLNKIGFKIYFEKIPIAEEVEILAKKLNLNLEEVIYYGGDYELILTIGKEKIENAIKEIEKVGGKLTIIGKVVSKGNFLVKDGKRRKFENKGWEHFRN